MSDELKSGKDLILEELKEKASAKQDIYSITQEIFKQFKKQLNQLHKELKEEMLVIDKRIEISYNEGSEFEADIKFSGDILLFTMHTNVFNFDDNHPLFQSDYVKNDYTRSYCGMIQIHNFLADSFRYNRVNDSGYLIARIFINKDNHFFVEGKRQLGFLYNDFSNAVINEVYIQAIIESAILYSIDFDLLVPPWDATREITVQEMKSIYANAGFATAKRMGYQLRSEKED